MGMMFCLPDFIWCGEGVCRFTRHHTDAERSPSLNNAGAGCSEPHYQGSVSVHDI